jgi:hypothetical protein
MRSLPSGSWIDLEFAEAACKRIAELEAENKQIRERLEFFEDDEYRQPGIESIQERYRGASEP